MRRRKYVPCMTSSDFCTGRPLTSRDLLSSSTRPSTRLSKRHLKAAPRKGLLMVERAIGRLQSLSLSAMPILDPRAPADPAIDAVKPVTLPPLVTRSLHLATRGSSATRVALPPPLHRCYAGRPISRIPAQRSSKRREIPASPLGTVSITLLSTH